MDNIVCLPIIPIKMASFVPGNKIYFFYFLSQSDLDFVFIFQTKPSGGVKCRSTHSLLTLSIFTVVRTIIGGGNSYKNGT